MNIAVLVSGGVDSSLALRLLHEQGHTLTAYYLKIWLEDELAHLGSCPWEDDLRYVRALCQELGVPLEIVPLQKEYLETVLAYTLDQVRHGYTPSPDIMCNSAIKFGAFFKTLQSPDTLVATGHYAQKSYDADGKAVLVRAKDVVKDQTYFLSRLTHEQLNRAIFPIGHLTKSEVRELARAYGIPSQDRPDSQGICFLGSISFPEFLKHHLGTREGNLVEYETGAVVGKHHGFWFYTIGQRQGIGLSGGPWYVVRKNISENIVYISRAYTMIQEIRQQFWLRDVHWLGTPITEATTITLKLRHGPHMHEGIIEPAKDGWYAVRLSTPDQGIAPGQFAVLYDHDNCWGSGIMEQNYQGV